MSSKYDRVSDKQHFSIPYDAHEYSDDVTNHNQTNGNGIYNDYTVELKQKPYNDTFKVLCFKFKNTKKCKFVLISSALVVCLLLVIIIVAASKSHGETTDSPKDDAYTHANKDYGLIAYGPDSNGVISYNIEHTESYMKYLNTIEHYNYEYSTMRQIEQLDKYTVCNNSRSSLPDGKSCMLTQVEFGPHCQHFGMYGINEYRTCVLLVLKLKADHEMPKPFNISGEQNDVHNQLKDRYSPDAVGISCYGKTPADEANIAKDKHVGNGAIDYNPKEGFPLKYFWESPRSDNYVNPAVMVQFNTINLDKKVSIRCTAWAENFNNGKPQNSEIYSTEFMFKINVKE